MKYSKKPKYKINKRKIEIPKDKEASAEEIYKEMLMDKIKKRKKR